MCWCVLCEYVTCDDEFFNQVKNALINQYPSLRRHLTSAPGHGPQYVTDQCGHDVRLTGAVTSRRDVIHDVSLSVSDERRALVVRDDGAMSWTMRDFQIICRNIAITAGVRPVVAQCLQNSYINNSGIRCQAG